MVTVLRRETAMSDATTGAWGTTGDPVGARQNIGVSRRRTREAVDSATPSVAEGTQGGRCRRDVRQLSE